MPAHPHRPALDDHLGQPPELVRHLPGPEDERYSLGSQATRHEGDRLRRRPVEPLCVVDNAQQRPLRSHLGQQGEQSQRHQQPIRRVASA
jgi:hypothetical protein